MFFFFSGKCKDNEQLSDCPSASCMPQTCKDALYPYICPPWSPGGCPEEPGCICSYGYLRDESGKCIPKDECRKCCCDSITHCLSLYIRFKSALFTCRTFLKDSNSFWLYKSSASSLVSIVIFVIYEQLENAHVYVSHHKKILHSRL